MREINHEIILLTMFLCVGVVCEGVETGYFSLLHPEHFHARRSDNGCLLDYVYSYVFSAIGVPITNRNAMGTSSVKHGRSTTCVVFSVVWTAFH